MLLLIYLHEFHIFINIKIHDILKILSICNDSYMFKSSKLLSKYIKAILVAVKYFGWVYLSCVSNSILIPTKRFHDRIHSADIQRVVYEMT